MKILGLDLSLNSPGYAVVEVKNGKVKLLESGIVKANPKHNLNQKLKRITSHLLRVYWDHEIDVVVRENSFVKFNKATKALERVVGAVYVSFGVEIEEIAPQKIKKLMNANSKETVESSVRKFLNLAEDFTFESNDASDAGAVALAFAIENELIGGMEK
ncbi:crossover junction endodeoxyribonuclease RuvC [Thermoactinomyces daqus]|uniref:Crossover junction endodeoxyribonuclease RuvC n=1 Tax=Thermoactinomyces daqus TaxID=1329516 RepID=A0A7W1XAA9_9BACL|nr:crossover junction endodeoxyribonuclease RuvC [Thermoactinomyces daqus]MBA4542932.1 crossover junction endodeoxyribonuclease RuvC [Thermoactinomyces daqus]